MTPDDVPPADDPAAGATVAWYRQSPDEALRRVDADRSGLDADEARRRRERHGPNRIREQTTVSAWRVLLDQFTSPLVYVLIGALAVTLAIGNYGDAIVVGAVLAVNATVGFVQEYRAQTAVLSLMEMVSPRATVRRCGVEGQVSAEDVVPGDVVLLTQGEIVPADTRLLDVAGLRVDESALTGESVPTDKRVDTIDEPHLTPADQHDMAFMGTAVTAGEGEGVVVATGSATEIGQISEQVGQARATRTPLEVRIDRLARWITVGILAVAIVAFTVGLLLDRSVTEMLLLAVALAVSAIPAGLPVVVTVALAIGVSRMARRHALTRQLAAVDTLGSCSTILSDKTGTLTENRMTVRTLVGGDERVDVEPESGDGLRLRHDGRDVEIEDRPALREVLLVGSLCNDARTDSDGAGEGAQGDGGPAEPSGDPMEVALLTVARGLGMGRDDLERRHPRRDKVPFRTERRFMATVHDAGDDCDGPLVLVKGAPERIAEMCDRRRTRDGGDEPIDRDAVARASERLAAEGLRVLAMAVGCGEEASRTVHEDDPAGLVLVGLQGLVDPPRASAVEAVDRCHGAGIRVAMVTGDHATTAAAIARQVHVERWPGRADDGDTGAAPAGDGQWEPAPLLTGRDIGGLSDDDLDRAVRDTNVFARVAPGQKLRLVERLKASGEVVAVTGDGVNDAPALEAAHIGASMGSGTDVAKEASDMVITDDDFASVYAAVEEGRTAFRNIRMATFFLLSTGVAEVLLILVALGLQWPLPLLPAQILWLNVITNGIADVALAFQPGEPALSRRPPRPLREGILDRQLLERLVVVGVWLAAGTLAVFWWRWSVADDDLTIVRTAVLTTLVLFQKVHVFNCRSEDASTFRTNLLANKVLLFGVLASLGVHVAALHLPLTQELLDVRPLSTGEWAIAVGFGLTTILVNEAHKTLRPRRRVETAADAA